MNFSSDEEEQNGVTRDNHETRNKEANKSNDSALDVACSSKISVLVKTTSKNNENSRNGPASNMVVFFQRTSLSVTSDNHLVEVERDTEGPQKVGQEVIVDKDRYYNAHTVMGVNVRFERN